MTSTSGVAVKVEGLTKAYRIYDKPIDRLKEALHPRGKRFSRDFVALSNISFELGKGETFGIIGRNGAGKSTLLKLITGVLNPTSGNIAKHGVVSSLLELGTGFDLELTGIENIYLYGSLINIPKAEMELRIDDILKFANIGAFTEQPVKTYSSGMFARLAFAVAINVTPQILIVDEVLSVGDATFQKKCIEKIQELRNSGVTVLLVSHDDYLIRQLCKNAMYLKDGECLFIGPSADCLQFYNDDRAKDSTTKGASEQAKSVSSDEFSFSIVDVQLKDHSGTEKLEFRTNDDVELSFLYDLSGDYNGKISFVVNIYSDDGVYIWGATSLMDGVAANTPQKSGRVKVYFDQLKLLSGRYQVRVAINDDSGVCILSEANPAIKFLIKDDFQAVGLVDLKRKWVI